MEKEIIGFEDFDLPLRFHSLHMREGGSYRGMHAHRPIEVAAVRSGTLECCVGEKQIRVCPGEVIFINSNVGHQLRSDHAEIAYLHIDVSLLEETKGESAKLDSFVSHTHAMTCLTVCGSGELTELLRKIGESGQKNARETYWYRKAYLYELVAFMYSRSFLSHAALPQEKLRKIGPAVRYIEQNFRMPLTLDEICSAVGYSKYTVCHLFKAATGASIFDYINFLRAYDAAEQLRRIGGTVTDIAMQCGFSSAAYFNRVFKSFFGCAPSVYRKFLQKNKAE